MDGQGIIYRSQQQRIYFFKFEPQNLPMEPGGATSPFNPMLLTKIL
jgi:hypothetical protein